MTGRYMRAILLWLLVLPWLGHAAPAQDLAGRARFLGGEVADVRKGAALTLDLSQGVPWRAFTLVDPPRLVLDFREVDWAGVDAGQMNRSQAVAALRMGPFSAGWSRLVAVLTRPALIREAGMTIDERSGQATLSILLKDASAAQMEAASGAPRDPRWDRPQALLTAPPRAQDAPLRIVLDPGHGGIDPGAERGGVREAALMLTFARQLRDVLRRAGYEVVLTREEDVFVSLEGRVAAAHEARADLFVSLHADAIEEGVAPWRLGLHARRDGL